MDAQDKVEILTEIARLEERLSGILLLHEERKEQQDKALTLAAERLNDRLGTMNKFREQIQRESATYATKEQLDIRVRPLERMFWGLSSVVALIVTVGIPLLVLLR